MSGEGIERGRRGDRERGRRGDLYINNCWLACAGDFQDAFRDDAVNQHGQRDDEHVRGRQQADRDGAAVGRLGIDAHRLRHAQVVNQRNGRVDAGDHQEADHPRAAGGHQRLGRSQTCR